MQASSKGIWTDEVNSIYAIVEQACNVVPSELIPIRCARGFYQDLA